MSENSHLPPPVPPQTAVKFLEILIAEAEALSDVSIEDAERFEGKAQYMLNLLFGSGAVLARCVERRPESILERQANRHIFSRSPSEQKQRAAYLIGDIVTGLKGALQNISTLESVKTACQPTPAAPVIGVPRQDTVVEEGGVDLFVSHSSNSLEMAEALTDLFQLAIGDSIRCTSVAGYGYDGGADIDESIQRDIHTGHCFLGLLDENAAQSEWVKAELYGRLALRKHFIPVVPGAAELRNIPPPLKRKNARRLDRTKDVLQLVEDVADRLGKKVKASVLSRHISKVVECAQAHNKRAEGAIGGSRSTLKSKVSLPMGDLAVGHLKLGEVACIGVKRGSPRHQLARTHDNPTGEFVHTSSEPNQFILSMPPRWSLVTDQLLSRHLTLSLDTGEKIELVAGPKTHEARSDSVVLYGDDSFVADALISRLEQAEPRA